MSQYDNNREVILSKVVSDNPNAPVTRARFELTEALPPGNYKFALWPMTRKDDSVVKDKNGNTLYKGKIEEDDYVAQNTPPAATTNVASEDFDTDDIPF